MTETTLLSIKRYRTPEQKPTCMVNAKTGDYCEFLMTSDFATREYCYWDLDNQLQRSDDGKGFLIPCESCKVWHDYGHKAWDADETKRSGI